MRCMFLYNALIPESGTKLISPGLDMTLADFKKKKKKKKDPLHMQGSRNLVWKQIDINYECKTNVCEAANNGKIQQGLPQ